MNILIEDIPLLMQDGTPKINLKKQENLLFILKRKDITSYLLNNLFLGLFSMKK